MKYVDNTLNSFYNSLTYRANLFISLFTRTIQISLSLLMWSAIYNSGNNVIGGYTKPEMFKYFILTGLLSFVFTFDPIFRLANLVKTGQLNTLLLRPISINLESFSYYLGSKITLIFILVGLIVLFAEFNFLIIIISLIYLMISLLLWHELMFLVGIASFWVIQMWPLSPIISAFYMFFGGLLFPLDVLPNPIYQLLRFFPVSLVSSDLIQTVIKSASSTNLLIAYIVASLIWLILFKLLTRITFTRGLRRFEGVGV